MSMLASFTKKMLHRAGDWYVYEWVKHEHACQAPEPFNERSIEYSFVFDCLGRCRPKSVLDVGTGDTALPNVIRHCGPHVDAIDYTRGYWDGGLINRHWYVQNHDISAEPPAKQYDFVTCVSVIEHIPRAKAAVHNMLKALAPGGSLVITCPYTESRYIEDVYPLIGVQNRYICRSYSRQEVHAWVVVGFEIAEQQYWRLFTGDFWRSGNRLPLAEHTGPDQPHQLTCLRIVRV
jgi:SAM-dependent methyltransferase